MAPSVAELPEAVPATITVPVKSLSEKIDATNDVKAESVKEAKPKIRRIIEEEGGKTTASVCCCEIFIFHK